MSHNSLRVALAALVVVVLLALLAPATAAPPPTVSVQVRSALSGRVLPGRGVTLAVAGASALTSSTGPAGVAVFGDLDPGSYRLSSVADTLGAFAPVLPGDARTATFTLGAESTTLPVSLEVSAGAFVRFAGHDRYHVATNAARVSFAPLRDVENVVVASGDDRAAADPLAAAGLAGAYGCPLVLVGSNGVPDATADFLAELPEGVALHVVGGSASIPGWVLADLGDIMTVGSVRRIDGATRYDIAVAIAREMRTVLGSSAPTTAIIANGADSRKFTDALAAGPVCYTMHYPLLLVTAGSVPGATSRGISDLGLDPTYIAGGTASVSDTVRTRLGISAADRLSGADRYGTSVAVARRGATMGWLPNGYEAGFAAKLPDSLTGGVACGRLGRPLLLTTTTALPSATRSLLLERRDTMNRIGFYGGTVSMSEGLRTSTMRVLF